jgi:hypothetical protein
MVGPANVDSRSFRTMPCAARLPGPRLSANGRSSRHTSLRVDLCPTPQRVSASAQAPPSAPRRPSRSLRPHDRTADLLRPSRRLAQCPEPGVALEASITWWAGWAGSTNSAAVLSARCDVGRVAGSDGDAVRLTSAAYASTGYSARIEPSVRSAPTGVGRALATYEIPIEGGDEWLAAARRLA